jgi:hypothetical protein
MAAVALFFLVSSILALPLPASQTPAEYYRAWLKTHPQPAVSLM